MCWGSYQIIMELKNSHYQILSLCFLKLHIVLQLPTVSVPWCTGGYLIHNGLYHIAWMCRRACLLAFRKSPLGYLQSNGII